MDKRTLLIGVLCGASAALCWAVGFVVAKHGIMIGFSPPELAFHRFFWSGLLLMPLGLRAGFVNLGGIGWRRGLIVSVLAGPPQAFIAYTGFILVPLGHGTKVQHATAALSGLILDGIVLHETMAGIRKIGAAAIVIGLLIYGAESFTATGSHGVAGDLLFVTAGIFWGTFGMLLRLWTIPGLRAIGAVAILSIVLYLPLYFAIYGWHEFFAHGAVETWLQIVTQGLIAGVLPIYLYARAVTLLGAGRTATFTALVPIFGAVIGLVALGIVPSVAEIIGMAIVLIGFRLTMR
jgi:drug/metabolite transporter (DMT)-like permease